MKRVHVLRWLCAVSLMMACADPAWSQEAARARKPKTGIARFLSPTDQDVFLPVTTVEWGSPDRWSFSARYVHMFQKERDHVRVLHNITVTLSPGTAGGRVGAGYENIFHVRNSRPGREGLTLLSEAKVVALRTWGAPISTDAGQKFIGGELHTSLAGVVNVGVGYYAPRSTAPGHPKAFVGLHVGVGI